MAQQPNDPTPPKPDLSQLIQAGTGPEAGARRDASKLNSDFSTDPNSSTPNPLSLSSLYAAIDSGIEHRRDRVTEPVQCGQYRLTRKLGEGGMGEVFEAEDGNLHRKVAVKRLREDLRGNAESRERFLREARAAAAVENDHLVTIYQVGEVQGAPYFAMQLLIGEPLDRRLSRNPPLTVLEVVRYSREIAEGLGAAHVAGLVHRDIKPSNIWLEDVLIGMRPDANSSGNSGVRTRVRVKIVDFGLAVRTAVDVRLTQTGYVMGTPAYMSPEQAKGAPFDYRTDLFSFGCVIFEMLIGRRPFQGASLADVMTAIQREQPPLLSLLRDDVPRELSDLVARMLAKQPQDRPASAYDIADRLAELEAKLSGKPNVARVNRTGSLETQTAPTPNVEVLPVTNATPRNERDFQKLVKSQSESNKAGIWILAIGAMLGIVLMLGYWFWFATGTVKIELGKVDGSNPPGEYVISPDGNPEQELFRGTGNQTLSLPSGSYRIDFAKGIMLGYEFRPANRFRVEPFGSQTIQVERRTGRPK
ncbi:serine/threonine-protein kinase [Tuwongella immobilis]|uniref:Protein kinase domain-containing protein n=1 Tax=Tuwongella immobilis TaxID=692036 RepID=A0A6C2YPY5_9BACT|nr:serine/threonine-protein kinase [Tuwongella immobilis]VIP03690.1 serine threonine protein partial : Protein containing Serine/threonine protein kinase OS=Rhodopirellula maiorica SM1 GN=RMSM_06979 PE=3 SV=1: Pkinase [Tuwongella immobilis]VTS04748.1 serine threonine protein partial : Protein containing Serine/threonine protein kinase OS=Rhodopirellula maiorica SM1 GN=RMSM_06979 PE=3 SV=1: Pkinase [Tuwongella immobilis]